MMDKKWGKLMSYFKSGKKQNCKELLRNYKNKNHEKNNLISGEKLHFTGVNGRDVYNITAPFESMGETIIAGRVEERNSEDSVVIFFVKENKHWVPHQTAPQFRLQDPFISKINNQLIFGGVEIFPHPEKKETLSWRTLFFRGKEINSLKHFASGPDGMKDIRLVQLRNRKIGIFTRPQGEVGGRGTIGFITINNINEFSIDSINKSILVENQFITEEWGGVNEVHLLKNGLLGVIGHIACFDGGGNRHYYPMAFTFDPENVMASPIEIIACRQDFPEGPAKRNDLIDVLFSGGLIRTSGGKAVLYVGVSDVEAHKIMIPDPFVKYE